MPRALKVEPARTGETFTCWLDMLVAEGSAQDIRIFKTERSRRLREARRKRA